MGLVTDSNFLDYEVENGGRIIGGSDALPAEFPHQIQLKYFGDHLCGASLISSFLVLTAAHCVLYKSPRRVKVVSGEHRLSVNDSTEQIRDARQILIHEDYHEKTFENDIAILVLANEFELNNSTQVIALPQAGMEFNGQALVTGWGRLLERVYSAGDTLQKVTVPIVPREICRASYSLVNRNVTEKMLCAGALKKDSCKADSGGPLTCTKDGKKYLCGIVSFGFGCGRDRFPGVYTNVAKYNGWIKSKIAEIRANNFCPPETFKCITEHDCIPNTFKCDDDNDCSDGSDEQPELCKGKQVKKCRLSQFTCTTSGQCLSYLTRCNGVNDCGDNSDEANCFDDSSENDTAIVATTSRPSMILPVKPSIQTVLGPEIQPQTTEEPSPSPPTIPTTASEPPVEQSTEPELLLPHATQATIEVAALALTTEAPSTSKPIVYDTSSPTPSPCPRTFFLCTNKKCVPSSFRCDHENDCGDNSDEESCKSVSNTNETDKPEIHCNSNQFQCASSKCIPASFKCDGDFDCGLRDISDEEGCPEGERSCAPNQFQCEKGKSCIPQTWECDGEFDCEDHSDEKNCLPVVTTVETPTAAPESQIAATEATTIIAAEGSSENEVLVESFPISDCGRFKFKCKSGECISNRWRCDGQNDCSDGSDERNC